MKADHTYIAVTETSASNVCLTIQPRGTDVGYNKITVMITPHDDGLHIHFSGLEGKMSVPQQIYANGVEIKYIKR